MNLADMLSYADIHQLNRIADHYACECNSNSKLELIQSILNTVNRKDVFEQYVEKLTLEDVRFLNSLLYDQRNSFSLEELVARAQLSRFDQNKDVNGPTVQRPRSELTQTGASVSLTIGLADPDADADQPPSHAKRAAKNKSGKAKKAGQEDAPKEWNARDMILRFKHQGWLFNGYSHQTKYLYQVPLDLKRRFGDSLARSFEKQLRFMEEPPVYRDEQGIFAEDVLHFLEFVYHNPIEVTAEGAMYKRSQQAILDCFSIKEELVGKGGWRFGYGRKIKEYPNRFSLIYDYCYYNGFIEELPTQLQLTKVGIEKIQSGKRENPNAIYRFWLRLYKNPVHNLQALVHWIDRLSQRWVTTQTLNDVLIHLIKPYYYDTPQTILHQRILSMMAHLGLIRIGEHPEAGTVVEMTKLGSSIIRGVYVPEEDKIALPEGE